MAMNSLSLDCCAQHVEHFEEQLPARSIFGWRCSAAFAEFAPELERRSTSITTGMHNHSTVLRQLFETAFHTREKCHFEPQAVGCERHASLVLFHLNLLVLPSRLPATHQRHLFGFPMQVDLLLGVVQSMRKSVERSHQFGASFHLRRYPVYRS